MDNFFYDLNKKLDGIRAKPETAQLNERGEKWIQKAVDPSHKGDLHKALHVAQGEKIPKAKIAKATHSKNPHLRHMAQFAKNVANEEMADEGNAFSKAVVDAKKDGIQPGEKIRVGGKQYPVKEAEPTGLGEKLNAPQLKKFAKLAPPRNKVTFADKIAGAKKEVDEMLGDVAADAMRSAVGHIKNKRSGEMDEGWDDMMKDVKQRAHSTAGMKTGERKRSSTGGEIEKTKTGLRHHARSHDHEEDDKKADDGAPKRKGRPKGPEKKPERVTGKAWKHKSGRVKEGEDDIEDRGEYDREGDMVKDNIHTIRREVDELEKIIGNNENLPEWVEEKLSQAKGMIMAASEYMQTQHERDAVDATGKEGITLGRKSSSWRQSRTHGQRH